jgi:hypothetical protein
MCTEESMHRSTILNLNPGERVLSAHQITAGEDTKNKYRKRKKMS